MLQARLERLIEHGVLERRQYQERPPRYEYRLTEKGLDLWPTIVALLQWGDRYAPTPGGPPVLLEHRGCGGAVDEHRICERVRRAARRARVDRETGAGRAPRSSAAPARIGRRGRRRLNPARTPKPRRTIQV